MRIAFAALIAVAGVTVLPGCCTIHSTAPTVPVLGRTIELPGVNVAHSGDGAPVYLDYLAYDPIGDVLFVTVPEQDVLDVIDLAAGCRVRRLEGLSRPQGMAVMPTAHRLAVDCRGENRVHVFDTRTFTEMYCVVVDPDIDPEGGAARYDALTNTMHLADHTREGRAITVLSAATCHILRTTNASVREARFRLNPNDARPFGEFPGAAHCTTNGVGIIYEGATGDKSAEITHSDYDKAEPFVIDKTRQRIVNSSQRPPRLYLADLRAAQIVAQADCSEDIASIFCNPQGDQVYAICCHRLDWDDVWCRPATPNEMGVIDMFTVDAENQLLKMGSTPTANRARTGYFVPAHHAVYVAVPPQNGDDARILEFRLPD